ncbi:DUF2971 domain-containing protein [Lachnospiraceae bacterium C1.1]|nr:DUF2971 domain-containing protein [Lachnospiraceae bacterium C1.1]
MKKVSKEADLLIKKPKIRAKGIIQPKDVELPNMNLDCGGEKCDETDEIFFDLRLSDIIKILNQAYRDNLGKYVLDYDQFEQIRYCFIQILIHLKGNHDIDFGKACKEFQMEWPSKSEILFEIIKAMLFSGEILASEIVENFCDNLEGIKTEDDEKNDYLLNIAGTYAEVGDYYLFSEGRVDIAFNYFRKMVDILGYIGMDSDEINQKVYFKEIQDAFTIFSFVYRAVEERKSLTKDFKRQDQKLAEKLEDGELIRNENNLILKDYLAKRKKIKSFGQYESLWDDTCKFYFNISKTRYSERTKKSLRLDLGVYYILLHKCIIYALADNSKRINRKQVAKLYSDAEFLRGLGLWRYKSVDDYIQKEFSGNVSDFNKAFDILVNVDVIRTILNECSFPKELAYYTTLSTLEYLLPISAQDPKYGLKEMNKAGMSAPIVSDHFEPSGIITSMVGRYSLMNVGHMNDPMEGRTLLFRLLEAKQQADIKSSLSNRYVFLKSFTDRVDDIPMWVMYGGGAEGCCIVLDKDKIIEEGNYKLAKVCYLHENNNNWELRAEDNKGITSLDTIGKCLDNLSGIIKSYVRVNKDKGMEKSIELLNPILYLFKSATYCHENEYRIIENTDYHDFRICYTKEKDGGRIYIPSKQRVYIKKIVLGPKFKAVEDTLPYLEYRCRFLAEELGLGKIEIKMSDADFI